MNEKNNGVVVFFFNVCSDIFEAIVGGLPSKVERPYPGMANHKALPVLYALSRSIPTTRLGKFATRMLTSMYLLHVLDRKKGGFEDPVRSPGFC